MREESPGASASAIQFHYDVSDDFYKIWLDPEMVYSAALFEPGDDLERAQIRKLDYHIEQAGAAGKPRVLDIGCGWGALLRRLVGTHGVEEAVGLTLSESQARKIEADAVPGVRVEQQSWRDYKPDAPFDAIVSIGAFEHFAKPGLTPEQKLDVYGEFFEFCHAALRPRAKLSLQTISFGRLRSGQIDPFIKNAIFPESELPFIWEVLRAADGLFDPVVVRNDRLHYRRTCREWLRNLEERRDEAVALVGEAKVDHYERYLKISVASFQLRALGLLRFTFDRIRAS